MRQITDYDLKLKQKNNHTQRTLSIMQQIENRQHNENKTR